MEKRIKNISLSLEERESSIQIYESFLLAVAQYIIEKEEQNNISCQPINYFITEWE